MCTSKRQLTDTSTESGAANLPVGQRGHVEEVIFKVETKERITVDEESELGRENSLGERDLIECCICVASAIVD